RVLVSNSLYGIARRSADGLRTWRSARSSVYRRLERLNTMARITVFGASGFAGRHIAQEAAGRGHEVTAVARDADRIDAEHPGVTARSGSIHDPMLVNEVAEGSDHLIVAVPAREIDGKKLSDSVPGVAAVASHHRTRLAFVG